MVLSRGKKVGIGAIILLAVLVIGFYVLGKYNDSIEIWLARRQERALQAWVDKNLAREKQAYREDTFGGKTPEETVSMFLTAIKAGDIVLASKYYELPLQEKAFENLKEEKAKYGNFEHTIAYFEEVMSKGTKQCNAEGDGCGFLLKFINPEEYTTKSDNSDIVFTFKKGQILEKIISFTLNNQSYVWKISN